MSSIVNKTPDSCWTVTHCFDDGRHRVMYSGKLWVGSRPCPSFPEETITLHIDLAILSPSSEMDCGYMGHAGHASGPFWRGAFAAVVPGAWNP